MNKQRPRSVLGALIRQQRELAELPMREFAKVVGISNPYLSQIERGLRAPSDAVLESIAETLDTSADELYRMAGFVERPASSDDESADLGAAIEAAMELTSAQRRAMLEIYRSFLDANIVRRTRAE
ncbi:helix-turn-helix domain-containing protein [Candidatus Mycobacterium methanotrophicum]|uniref:Helix-turn-helix domain-containing protein n=1 Tax=Candidatus Mycobacterium methanotrophicum TaxID=2943498 RepID=A0ABY4QHB9_9MYCO|nr:helix-turn-helix transcriptional regulator [Candidatus Mycobacterium methanotrophicum]UQX10378.1 helix-turn-helix domain-containing protein [Candidatus Mycobacterium methanotrophicum]